MKILLGISMLVSCIITLIFYYYGRKCLIKYRSQKNDVIYNKAINYFKLMLLGGIVCFIFSLIVFIKYRILS